MWESLEIETQLLPSQQVVNCESSDSFKECKIFDVEDIGWENMEWTRYFDHQNVVNDIPLSTIVMVPRDHRDCCNRNTQAVLVLGQGTTKMMKRRVYQSR